MPPIKANRTWSQKAVGVVVVLAVILTGMIGAFWPNFPAHAEKPVAMSTVCDTVIWQQYLNSYVDEKNHGDMVVVQTSNGRYVHLLVPRDSAGPIIGKIYLFVFENGISTGRFSPWKDCKELPSWESKHPERR
ncbi:hypothetical protein KW800_02790 [Candidatus Parcubacteria bacterium]|nr:hypothetical protein [Candidatus Parcubacteria bacterium]